jgi:hypothetical protein
MSPVLGMPGNLGERPRWLAGAPGFEPGNGGIKIRLVCMIYQGPFRKIAEIGPLTRQEVSSHFGMPRPSGTRVLPRGERAPGSGVGGWWRPRCATRHLEGAAGARPSRQRRGSRGDRDRWRRGRRSPRCTARQCLPHVGLGQAELPGDLRWLDANLEGSTNGIQLARRQMNGGRLGSRIVRGLN